MSFINRPDLAAAQSEFESACHCSRFYNDMLASYCAQYGDHGPAISGAGRDHFPEDVKAHLRRVATSVSHHCDLARAARPARVRHVTIRRLGQEVATRDGVGFYGPASLV